MMKAAYTSGLILLAFLLSQSDALGQRGCAFYMYEYGDLVGSCDLNGSLCSYGCGRGFCWKQCLYGRQCVTNHRGWVWGRDKSGDFIKCSEDDDCIVKGMNFEYDGSNCEFLKNPPN